MPVKSTRPLLLSYSPTDGCMGLPGPHARCGLRGRPVLWRPYRLATRQLVTEVIIVRRQHGRPAVACVIVPLTAVGDVVGIDQSIHVTCHRLITTARGARFNDRGRLIAIMLMYIHYIRTMQRSHALAVIYCSLGGPSGGSINRWSVTCARSRIFYQLYSPSTVVHK